MHIFTKFDMDKAVLFLIFVVFGFSLFAQSNVHPVIITENTSADSILKPLLGVISGPDQPPGSPAPNLTQRFHEIGVFSVRNNDYYDDRLDMEQIFHCPDTSTYPSWECDPYDTTNYDWAASDAQFQSYVDGGFEPFLRLGGEWANVLHPRDFIGPQNTLQETNWIIAAIHEVERYGNWKGDTTLLKYIDIWTETSPHFWTRPYSDFYDFWARALDSLKTHFPQYKIGGPGVIGIDMVNEEKGSKVERLLRKLYHLGLKPDFIDWHLWQNDPAAFYKATQEYRNLLNGTGNYSYVEWAGTGYFSDVELICGAFGVSTLEFDSNGNRVLKSKKERNKLYNKKKGVAILTGIWIALQYADIERSYYYRSGDVVSNPNTNPNDPNSKIGGPGLFYGDSLATYKPSAHAFRFWSYLVNNYPKLLSIGLPSIAADSSKLWVLAAKNDDGQYAVLVSNTGDKAVTYNLNILGKPVNLSNFSNAEIYTINDSDDGLTPHHWNGNDFMILPNNVQLVLLDKNTTGVNDVNNSTIKDILLKQNYPNPFNNTTTIEYSIPQGLGFVPRVKLSVYDILGKEIEVLENTRKIPGKYKVNFNANGLPGGVYFYKLTLTGGSKEFTKIKRMIVM